MRFCVLGPLTAWDGDAQVPLGPGRQRALLALLLLRAGEVVSTDRLVDDLWGERPPPSAPKVVQGYVSQLRRVLPPGTIETRGSGYVAAAPDTDAAEFERLLAAAREQFPREAVATLGQALALWRGRAFDDVGDEPWARAEAARLEELRLVALEERCEALLQLGESARLVPELESLMTAHPLRERPRALLMLALYRAGRQADALGAYAEGRRRLVGELGLEPGSELQELQRRILAHDPELGPIARPRPLALAARRARWLVLAGAAVLSAAGAGAWLLVARNSGAVFRADSLVLLDGRTGRVGADVGVGGRPSQLAVSAGALWVLDSDDSTISKIDTAARREVATFAAGLRPVALATAAGSLWVANARETTGSQVEGSMLPSTLTKVDPATRGPLQTVRLPSSAFDTAYGRLPGTRLLAAGAGSLWTVGTGSLVLRVDARTGRVRRRYPIPADSLAFGGGELWIVQQGRRILRLDPRTNSVDFAYPLAAGPGLAYGFGSAWVADPVQGLVWRLTPGSRYRARSIPVPAVATALVVSDGAVWASSVLDDEVLRIDPRANRVTTVVPLDAPQDLAPARNGVWVATGARPSSSALPAGSCGPVVFPGPGRPRFVVASDLALQGSAGASTRAIQGGIEEVIRERRFHAGRFSIGYQSCDDSTAQAGSFDWAKCVANARAYAADRDVIGVVGTYNSGCSYVEIPILDRAPGGPLALVSPLNTDPQLTIPAAYGVPGYRMYPAGARNFARVIAADQIQYAADAVLLHRLGARRIGVCDDGSPESLQEARWFAYSARRLGLATVPIRWNPDHPDPGAAVERVRSARIDGIFVAGVGLPGGAPLVAALRAALPRRTPIVLTDWFWPAGLRHFGRGQVDGVYLSLAGMPDSALPPAGRRLVARVGSRLSVTAAYGGSAAEVLLDAIARSNGTRASVARELFRTRIRNGILGTLTIGPNGDPLTAPVTIFRMRRGARDPGFPVDDRGAVVAAVISPPPAVVPGAPTG